MQKVTVSMPFYVQNRNFSHEMSGQNPEWVFWPNEGITNIGADLGAKRKPLHYTHIIAGFNKTKVFSDFDVDCSWLGKSSYFGLKNWFTKSKSGLRSSQRVC